jgi:hypothetical protein
MKKLLIMAMLVGCSGADDSSETTNNSNNSTNSTSNNATNNQTTANNTATNSQTNNTSNVLVAGQVVINEVVASGTPDWVELFNTSDQELDLSGAYLSDDVATEPTKAQLPAGTKIAANGYLVLDISDETLGFKVGSDEEIALIAVDGSTLLDRADWAEGEAPELKSFGRIPNATGPFKTLDTPTPGAANQDNVEGICGNGIVDGNEVCDGDNLNGADCVSQGFADGPLVCAVTCVIFNTDACIAGAANVVINELTSAGDDSIELYNSGTASGDLSGWYIGDSAFDPADVVGTEMQRYVFPAATTLAAGEYLVLTKNVEHSFGVGGQDSLTLFDAAGTVKDSVIWSSGDATPSYCRKPDGGAFEACDVATFGSAN